MKGIATHDILKLALTLEVISPVHVGGDQGQTRSAYTDYVISKDGKEVCYIRPSRMNEILTSLEEGDRKLLQAIREGIWEHENRFRLRDFFDGYGVDPEEGSIRLPNFGMVEEKHQEIQPMEKSAGRPYLPGSSLKGAIRTAMLYEWLTKDQQGKKKLQNLADNLSKIIAATIEVKNLRALKKKEKWLSEENQAKLGKAERVLSSHNIKEEWLFGSPSKDARMLSQCIQVADTSFAGPGDFGIWHMRRERLSPPRKQSNPTAAIPFNREAIVPGTRLHTGINIVPYAPLLQGRFKDLSLDPTKLGRLLNEFSLANIRRELAELNRAGNMPNKTVRKDFQIFYEGLLHRIAQGEIIFRLGGGKTWFDNSLALVMLAADLPSHLPKDLPAKQRSKVRSELPGKFAEAFGKATGGEQFWPVTRTVAFDGRKYLPPGWVKLDVRHKNPTTEA